MAVAKLGKKLLVHFNGSKVKVLSFNHHVEPFLSAILTADARLQENKTMQLY